MMDCAMQYIKFITMNPQDTLCTGSPSKICFALLENHPRISPWLFSLEMHFSPPTYSCRPIHPTASLPPIELSQAQMMHFTTVKHLMIGAMTPIIVPLNCVRRLGNVDQLYAESCTKSSREASCVTAINM